LERPGGWFVSAGMVVAIAIMGMAYVKWSPVVCHRRALAQREAALRAEVDGLAWRGLEMERTRESLLNDAVMIESVARQQLRYAAPGEIVHPMSTAELKMVSTETPKAAKPPQPVARPETGSLMPALRGALVASAGLMVAGLLLAYFVAGLSGQSQLRSQAITPRT